MKKPALRRHAAMLSGWPDVKVRWMEGLTACDHWPDACGGNGWRPQKCAPKRAPNEPSPPRATWIDLQCWASSIFRCSIE